MKTFAASDHSTIVLAQGDITEFAVEGIVNAANERMLGGGGVDGAIHRAAGPALRQACAQVPESSPGVRCPTGEARITPGFNLPAQWVIHAVGPVYRGPESAILLASAYRSSLALAHAHALSSLAFPAISCGVYGYPLEAAATVALETCRDHGGSLEVIQFALFGADSWRAFTAVAGKVFSS